MTPSMLRPPKPVARCRLMKLSMRPVALRRSLSTSFKVVQYNVLAKRYSRNTEPWFLYGGLRPEGDSERAAAIAARHTARGADGRFLYEGWPAYVDGILTGDEIARVERIDAKFFPFEVRAPKLIDEIRRLDAGLLSLVEVDEYDEFWKPELEGLGYESLWYKRPRSSSPDGCAIAWRSEDWSCEAHRGIHYDDGGTRDRGALLALLRRRSPEGERCVFVSTHLARNPESSAQQCVRLCQVAQLMEALSAFCADHAVEGIVPSIVGGDWNAESLEEIRAVAQATCRLESKEVHPLLFGAVDVPTPATSRTLLRQNRIDYIMYQENFLKLIPDAGAGAAQQETCIPDADNPSDHVPIAAEFEFHSQDEYERLCAERFVKGSLKGDLASRPMLQSELVASFAAIGAETPADAATRAEAAGLLADDAEKRAFVDLFEDVPALSVEDFTRVYAARLHDTLDHQPFLESIRCAFRFFDSNGDGFVSSDEFRETLRMIDPTVEDATIARILRYVDENEDGMISPDEFASALLRAYSASLSAS